jgi:hypothetical protein
MAKTNFTKAEEALAQALEQMKVQELLSRADKAAGKPTHISKERGPIAQALQRELKKLHQIDKDIYKKLGTKRKDLEKLLAAADQLSKEDWANIVHFKEQVDAFIKQLPQNTESNEKIVEEERRKHINKRFNVSDKWLPLK